MTRSPYPTTFDLELDSERGRWLRKRFLWFCAVSFLLSLPMLPGVITSLRTAAGSERLAALVYQGGLMFNGLLFAVAFAFAWNTSPVRRRILRLALLLSCITGLVLLISLRIAVAIDPRPVMGDDPTRQAAAPTAGAVRITPETMAMFMSLYFLLATHLLTCIFIPWTIGESLPLTGSLLATFLIIAGVDAATGRVSPFFALGGTIVAFVVVLPGLAICWRRHRRFRRDFRLRFESRGYRKLQNELADARRVHESCLPQPIVDGPVRMHYVYEPMQQIGGDLLFSQSPNGDGSILNAVLLDVTGHGIAAALTVNRIVGELQRIFGEHPNASPGDVLTCLNRYVCVTLSQHDLYMSAICMRVDSTRSIIEYASGGHPTAFLRRGDGRIEMLESTTFLLGLEDPDRFKSEPASLTFNAGDALIAYTDGAAEAKDKRNTMLGMAGVQRIMEQIAGEGHAPADWPGGMLQRVLEHRAAPPDDDTLVVALFRPS